METSVLALYLKWNLLLGVAWLLWVFSWKCAHLSGLGSNYRQQLRLARWFFALLLLIAPVMMISQLLQTAVVSFSANSVVGEMLIGASIEKGLNYSLQLGENTLSLSAIAFLLLPAGLGARFYRLVQQIGKLRQIIKHSTEWKHLGRVQVMFSPSIATPFSTKALGRSQIVLPNALVKAPRHLRLVVMHEMQHLRNHDLDWVLLMEAVKVLCFWNPAIHLWSNEFECLQEFACDEALLDKGKVDVQTYGHCLLDVASDGPGLTLVAASNMVPRFSMLRPHHSQLKRRIHMLGKYKSVRHSCLKSMSHMLLAGGGLTVASLLVFGAEAQEPRPMPQRGLDEFVFSPASTTQPRYPQRALDEKLQGWVLVNFTVTPNGQVEDAAVVDGCVERDRSSCAPNDDVFHANSLAAVQEFTFEPRVEDGVAVATPGVQYVFRFTLTEED